VAFKRFADYIPMIIDFELLKGFERTLDDALFKGMALGEDQVRQRCAAFLKEDPAIVRRRKSLHQDLERFEAALADLQNIPALNSSSGYCTDEEVFEAPDESEGNNLIPMSMPFRGASRTRSGLSSRYGGSVIMYSDSQPRSPAGSHVSAIAITPQETISYHDFEAVYQAPADDDEPFDVGGSSLMEHITGGSKKKKGSRKRSLNLLGGNL
jgi:Dynamin GTPase effector domain